jgi:hypothetical protein
VIVPQGSIVGNRPGPDCLLHDNTVAYSDAHLSVSVPPATQNDSWHCMEAGNTFVATQDSAGPDKGQMSSISNATPRQHILPPPMENQALVTDVVTAT